MKECGKTIYLIVSVSELTARLEGGKHTRPVLKNRSGEELRQFIQENLQARSSFYEQAQVIFDAEAMTTVEDVNQIVEALLPIIESSDKR